ncbi:MAG: hypothetical protein PHG79_11460 [Methanosarcina sp.]|nr:hypothetical protein [Methanosarcina sp.]
MDSILCGIGSGAVDDVIASKSGVQPDVVESVRKAMKRARFAAGLPQVCRRFAAGLPQVCRYHCLHSKKD